MVKRTRATIMLLPVQKLSLTQENQAYLKMVIVTLLWGGNYIAGTIITESFDHFTASFCGSL